MINCCKSIGFVFKKEDRGDADRIFSIFTEEFGRIEIFAKAIRKISSKLKSGINIFSISEIEFVQGKSKKTLTDALLVDGFNKVKTSPKRFKIANQISKALGDFLKEQERDDRIFILLKESLDKLNEEFLLEKNCNLIYYYFLWNFFAILGFKPEINRCADCCSKINPLEIYFCCKEGGIICKNCFDLSNNPKKINADVVKVLRLILENNWQTISKLKINSASQKLLQEVSDSYYFYLLNK